MQALRRVMYAAAVAVVGGTSFYVAFQDAAQDEGYTEAAWVRDVQKLSDPQKQKHFYVVLQSGATLPQAVTWGSTGVLLQSSCSNNVCSIAPSANHPMQYRYTYKWVGPRVDGWRVADVHAHPKIALGWKKVAEQQSDFKWLGEPAKLQTACLAHATPAKCKTLLNVDGRCWVWDSDPGTDGLQQGEECRYGKRVGVDLACMYNYTGTMLEFPCNQNRGAGAEMQDAKKVWTDAEMDDL